MKFLLTAVNAKYIHSNPAIYSLRAYCEKQDPKAAEGIELAEYTINQPRQAILADIYRKKPDVIAFSCYIWNWSLIRSLTGELSKLLPGVPIWLGGPEVSYDAEQTLAGLPRVTGVMVGEGEQTCLELVRYYGQRASTSADKAANGRWRASGSREVHEAGAENGLARGTDGGNGLACVTGGESGLACGTDGEASLVRIPGIVYREVNIAETTDEITGGTAEEIRRTAPRPLTDISGLPFFYDEKSMEDFHDRIIYYESSRGCPYRCSYCLSSIDKTVRLRELELVKRELQFFLDQRAPQVKFVDRTFNCNHRHAMEIWRYLAEHDNGITNFHFEIAADILTEEELSLLEGLRPGLVQLEIGVQSTNPDTIQEIRRVMDWERLKRVVARLQRGRNIHLHLDLIAGLPFEDLDSFRRSFNDVYACRPEQLQLGFLKVLKGSYMHEMAKEYGIVYTDEPPYEVLFTRWLPYEHVLVLKQVEEMVESFYNSGQFTYALPLLESRFPSPFHMYRALADFYEEQGLFVKSPSRLHRYETLMDFALEVEKGDRLCTSQPEKDPDVDKAGGWEALFRQLLTLDLYLRENVKNRPAFALPLPAGRQIREQISAFYRREEQKPSVLKEYAEAGYDSRQMERMTHLEYFTFPSQMLKGAGMPQEALCRPAEPQEGFWLLFDYHRRDPLTQNARVIVPEGF